MKDNSELNLEIELIKKDINDIKNNHLQHIETDMRDVKIEIFRFKYIVYGAVIVFALLSDNIEKIINLFQEITMPRLNEGPGDPRMKMEKGRYSRPKMPQRPMKRCPDGSSRPTYSPCPPRRMKPKVPRKPITRTEQFKRDRTTIYKQEIIMKCPTKKHSKNKKPKKPKY